MKDISVKIIIHVLVYTIALVILLTLVPYKIASDRKEDYYEAILEYRTEQAIYYSTSSLKDITGEFFCITVYGLDDTERAQYKELYRSLSEINISETPIGELMGMIDIFELKKYEDYRISLMSNRLGFEIKK